MSLSSPKFTGSNTVTSANASSPVEPVTAMATRSLHLVSLRRSPSSRVRSRPSTRTKAASAQRLSGTRP